MGAKFSVLGLWLGLGGLGGLGGIFFQAGCVHTQGLWLEKKFSLSEVVDGDTWKADFDGDGSITIPEEKLRLVYVDTPELNSKKDWNRADAERAEDFLRQSFQDWQRRYPPPTKVEIWLPQGIRRGKYGRLLGQICLGKNNLNLDLVRQGWSVLNTRYQVPSRYDDFLEAESQAFEDGVGIWKKKVSRQYYLERLRDDKNGQNERNGRNERNERNGRTVHSKENPAYRGLISLKEWDRERQLAIGKFVELEGVVQESFRRWQGGWLYWKMILGANRDPLEVRFSLLALRRGPHVEKVRVGEKVRVDGWLHAKGGKYWLKAHYVRPADSSRLRRAKQAEWCRRQK